jgi:maltose/moltooligosaccharide transporter
MKENIPRFGKHLLAILVNTVAISFYGTVESQWFNSYVTNPIIGTGYTDIQMSYMVSTSAVMGAIAFIFWGLVSDNLRSRYGRRKPIYIWGSILTAIFVYLFGRSNELWWLIVCDGLFIGFTSNMFHSTSRALIPDLFPQHVRGKVNLINTMGSFSGTFIIWFATFVFKSKESTQIYFTKQQFDYIFLICGGLLLLSAITVFFLVQEPDIQELPRTIGQDLLLLFDINEMRKHKDFLKLFIASVFVIIASNAYLPWLLKIVEIVEFPAEKWKIYVTIGCIVAIIAPFLIRFGTIVDQWGRKKGVFIGLCAIILSSVFLTFSNFNFYLVAIGFAGVFGLGIAKDVAIDTWTQDLLPPESRAKFLGIINIGRAIGQVPGVLIAGFVSNYYGMQYIFLVSAVFLLIAIIFFHFVPETIADKRN